MKKEKIIKAWVVKVPFGLTDNPIIYTDTFYLAMAVFADRNKAIEWKKTLPNKTLKVVPCEIRLKI